MVLVLQTEELEIERVGHVQVATQAFRGRGSLLSCLSLGTVSPRGSWRLQGPGSLAGLCSPGQLSSSRPPLPAKHGPVLRGGGMQD